jgi:hypothetical protein
MASALNIFGAIGRAVPEALTLYQREEELQNRAKEMRATEEYRMQELDLRKKAQLAQEKNLQDESLTRELDRKKKQLELDEAQKVITERERIVTLEADPSYLKMPEDVQRKIKEYVIDTTGAEITELGTTKIKKGLWDKVLLLALVSALNHR